MLGSCPYFGKFQNSYNEINFKHLKNVLRYTNKTKDYCLCYSKLDGRDVTEYYGDADFANDTIDRKSVSGYSVQVFGNNKQSCVRLSSTEFEYVDLASAATESLYESHSPV
ncbi:hypothetical protein PR048_025636 [Dryococelus australis]|uniref:Uncharacterized protein n=1 Tax=Dryococelus australis TaxID=614101 RepID=A0ABQ9GRZ5_9NEOP|nr:hypothetical protein PR048_025636 [Dryococelus australis]